MLSSFNIFPLIVLVSVWMPWGDILSKNLIELELEKISNLATNIGCQRISRGNIREPNLQKLSELKNFISNIHSSIKKSTLSGFEKNFHPNFHAKKSLSEKIGRKITLFYGKEFDIHLHRVFILNSKDHYGGTHVCKEDGLVLSSYYGYPVAVGVILAINGKEELGRIFSLLVPSKKDNRWYIAGWHHQQWSYLGQDYTYWVKMAQKSVASNSLLQVYSYLDISQKLLFGGKLLRYLARKEILVRRDQTLGNEKFSEKLKKLTKDSDLIYAGTLMAEEAPGVLLRFKLKKELPTNILKEKCANSFRALIPAKLVDKRKGGIRCGFVLPYETDEKDGRLGSIFLRSSNIEI